MTKQQRKVGPVATSLCLVASAVLMPEAAFAQGVPPAIGVVQVDTAPQDIAVTSGEAPQEELAVTSGEAPQGELAVETGDGGLQDAAPAETVQDAAPAETVQDAAPAETVQDAAPAETVQDAAPAETVQDAATIDTSATAIAAPASPTPAPAGSPVAVDNGQSDPGELQVGSPSHGQKDLQVGKGSETGQIVPTEEVPLQTSTSPVETATTTSAPIQGSTVPIQEPEPPSLREVVARDGWDAYLHGGASTVIDDLRVASAPAPAKIALPWVSPPAPAQIALPWVPPPTSDLDRFIRRLGGFSVTTADNDDFVRTVARELAGFNAGRTISPRRGTGNLSLAGPKWGDPPEPIDGTSGWKPELLDNDGTPARHVTAWMAMGYFHPRAARGALDYHERADAQGASQQDVESGLIALELGEDLRRGRLSVDELIDELRRRLEDPSYRGGPRKAEPSTKNGLLGIARAFFDSAD